MQQQRTRRPLSGFFMPHVTAATGPGSSRCLRAERSAHAVRERSTVFAPSSLCAVPGECIFAGRDCSDSPTGQFVDDRFSPPSGVVGFKMDADQPMQPTDPIVIEFKTGDEPAFKKPDHDPHGETGAAVAHSSTACDNPECETVGLVLTGHLENASEHTRGPERDVVCSATCASEIQEHTSKASM